MTSVREWFAELRRRKVIRAAGIYVVVAWAVIQVGEATFPSLALPDWALRLVIVLAVIGRVWCHAHHFIFTIVNPKAEIGSKGRV